MTIPSPHAPILVEWKTKSVQLSADAEFQAKRFSLNRGGQKKCSSVCAAEADHQDQTSVCRAKATANPGTQSCLGQGCNDPQPGLSMGLRSCGQRGKPGSRSKPEAASGPETQFSRQAAQCPLVTPAPCQSTGKEMLPPPHSSLPGEEHEES